MSADDDDDDTLEGTLALIKPDAAHKEDQILERIVDQGFLVVEKRRMRFTKRVAERFYEAHRNKVGGR
jgi:nucleoside diphosphate kinase